MDLRRYLATERARMKRAVTEKVARIAVVLGRAGTLAAISWRRSVTRLRRDAMHYRRAARLRLMILHAEIVARGRIGLAAGAQLAGRSASRIAVAWASLRKAIRPFAASVRRRLADVQKRMQRWVRSDFGGGLMGTAAWLRTRPLGKPLRGSIGGRPAPAPAKGRFRIEVAAPASRYLTLGGILLFAALVVLPAFAGRTLVNDLIFMFTMLALAQYWNLLAGYAGLVSVGQQAFVGLGGYVLFALTIHAGFDPLVAIVLGGIIAATLALPTALVVFRLRGAYFAIGTWVMAEVYRLVFAQFRQLGGGTGTSLPPFVTNEVTGIEWVKELFDVRTSFARDIITYWFALILAAATILVVYLVLQSRHGLALAAIRDSEPAAESVGVDSFRTKLKVYVITAAGTGMVGALIYLQKARISPDAAFSVLDWTAYVIFIVVIGGIGTIEGPILGVLILYVLQTNLAHLGTWYLILLGLFAIMIMLFVPAGIWGHFAARYGVAVFPLRRLLVERTPKPTDT